MKKALSLALAVAGSLLASCPIESTQKATILCQALDHFYNREYPAASSGFDRYIALDPNDPVGYWRKLMAEYLQTRIAKQAGVSPTPAQYQMLMALGGVGVSKAKAKIDIGEAPDFNRYVEASTMALLAILEFESSKIWEGTAAKATMKEALRIATASRYQDAGFLVGSTNYEASKRNIIVQAIAGFPHSKAKGKLMIFEAAAKNNSPFVDDIWFYIFTMETDKVTRAEYEKTERIKIWRYLFTKYPRNSVLIAFRDRDR